MTLRRTHPAVRTEFLNVDLRVKARHDLAPLLDALDANVVVLHRRRHRGFHDAWMELYEFSRYLEPETCIAGFARFLESLPSAARRVWDRATHRHFDIGIEAAHGATYTALLSARTLRRVADLRAEIIVTVYAPRTRRDRVR